MQLLYEGSSVAIKCWSYHQPHLLFRDNLVYFQENVKLYVFVYNIINAKMKDNGTYTCTGTLKGGESFMAQSHIFVGSTFIIKVFSYRVEKNNLEGNWWLTRLIVY